MRWPRFALVVLALLVVTAGLYLWWWLPRREAQQLAAAAATPDQAALWGQRGSVPEGIRRLPAPDNPIARPAPATQPSQRIPPAAVSLSGVQNGGRLLATTEPGPWMYSGPARVAAVDDVRLTLTWDGNRSATIAVRLGGRPLPVAVGDTVQIDLRESSGPIERRQVLGIQTASGATLLLVFASGEQPVTFSSAFGTVAARVTQRAVPPGIVGGSIPAAVQVGSAGIRAMSAGERQDFARLMVLVLISRHQPDPNGEVGPYVFELVGWWAP